MLADILGSQKPSKYADSLNSLPAMNHVHSDLAIVDFAEKMLADSSTEWNSSVICRIVQTCTAPQQYTGLMISECIRRNDLVVLLEILKCWGNIQEIELLEILCFCIERAEQLAIMQFPEKDSESVLHNSSNIDLILYKLLSSGITPSFLEAALAEFSSELLIALMEILERILNINYECGVIEGIKFPNIENVISWISALLDAKFGQLVIDDVCHQAFFKLNKSLRSLKRNFYQTTKSFKGTVAQIELVSKRPIVKSAKKRKLYSIEVLHF